MTLSPQNQAGTLWTRYRGLMYAVLSLVLVSTNFVTAKYALRAFTIETFSTLWTGSATVYCLVLILWREGPAGLLPRRGTARPLLIMGGITAGSMILSWTALQILDPSFMSFIVRFQPAFMIMLGVIFLHERSTGWEYIAIGVMLAGGLYSSFGSWQAHWVGIVCAVGAAGSQAVVYLIAKIYCRSSNPSNLTLYRIGLATLILPIYMIARGKADFAVPASYYVVLFLGAFMGPFLSHIMLFKAYEHWDFGRCAVVMTAQPLVVIPLAYIFLKNLPTSQQLVGGCIILAGAFWLARVTMRQHTH